MPNIHRFQLIICEDLLHFSFLDNWKLDIFVCWTTDGTKQDRLRFVTHLWVIKIISKCINSG